MYYYHIGKCVTTFMPYQKMNGSKAHDLYPIVTIRLYVVFPVEFYFEKNI